MRYAAVAVALASGVASAAPLAAEAQEWRYTASFYLYTAATDLRLGPVEAELSFSDALEKLDIALMATAEATNDQWSFVADYVHLSISGTIDTPLGFGGVAVDQTTQYLSGYALYRVWQDAALTVDLGGGLRWFDIETQASVAGGGPSASAGADWVDPLVAARAIYQFSDRWSGTLFLDWGGDLDDQETWQVVAIASYSLNDRWLLRGGYRFIEFNNTLAGRDFSFAQSGPVLGVTYRF